MKTLKQTFQLCAPLLLLVTSCTIDKRLYTSGYNIQWKNTGHSIAKQETVKDVEELTISEKNNFQGSQNIKQKVNKSNNIISDKNLTTSSDKSMIYTEKRSSPIISPIKTKAGICAKEEKIYVQSYIKEERNNSPQNKKEQEANSHALASLVLGILSFIPALGWYLGMFAIIQGIMAVHEIKSEEYDAFDFIDIGLLSLFTAQIPLIVLGIKALIRVRKEPKSREKVMAKAGIICGIIGILLSYVLICLWIFGMA